MPYYSKGGPRSPTILRGWRMELEPHWYGVGLEPHRTTDSNYSLESGPPPLPSSLQSSNDGELSGGG